MKLFFLLTFLLLSFNACSNKQNVNLNSNQTNKNIQILEQNDPTDEFADEFNEHQDIQTQDPLESYNRLVFSFNDKLYMNVLNPVSKAYSIVIPEFTRKGISNVFKNLFYPIRLSNNLLQGKFQNSYDETLRFLINTTIGLFGIMDPATSEFDIKEHNEDFGQTLGYWGVQPGPYIVLPLLGSSNLRDVFSMVPDTYVSATNNFGNLPYKIPETSYQSLFLYGTNIINKNSLNLGIYESIKKDSIDFYTFTKNFYENKRINDIKE